MGVAVWLVFVLRMYFIAGASGLEVTISPEHIHTREANITVRCQTQDATPLADCQFRVWFVGLKTEGELLNTTDKDHVAVKNTSPVGSYSAHFDKNFNIGECGVRLKGLPGNQLLIGCKLTTSSNMTAVKTMSILIADHNEVTLIANTEQLVVDVGGQVTFSAKMTQEVRWLEKCVSTLPNKDSLYVAQDYTRVWSNGANLTQSRYAVHWGPSEGECSFTISEVQELDNGVFFVVANAFNTLGAKAVTLIVKNPNSDIELSLSEEADELSAGDSVTATCSVHGVRQPDVLVWTWSLGDRSLQHGSKGYSNPDWRWPWQEASVSQTITFTLEDEDNGKDIICQVEGVGTASETLAVASHAHQGYSGLVPGIESLSIAVTTIVAVIVPVNLIIGVVVVVVVLRKRRGVSTRVLVATNDPSHHKGVPPLAGSLGSSAEAGYEVPVAKRTGQRAEPEYLVMLSDSEGTTAKDGKSAGPVSNPEGEYEEINPCINTVARKSPKKSGMTLKKASNNLEEVAYDDVNCAGPGSEPEPVYEKINENFGSRVKKI